MSAGLAIVLLLNGVQVDLPRPAMIIDGVACVPVRAVCERLGALVQAPDAHSVAVLSRREKQVFTVVDALTPQTAAGAVRIGGFTYVSGRAIADALGGRSSWVPDTRTLSLYVPWAGTAPLEISEPDVSARPLFLRDSLVAVHGRHNGRLACAPRGAAQSKPAVPGAFRLGDTEDIYCDSQEFASIAPPPSPLSSLGREVAVNGYVSVAGDGQPFLKPISMQMVGSRNAIAFRVTTDRLQYEPGASVVFTIIVRNDQARPVELPASDAEFFCLDVVDPAGRPIGVIDATEDVTSGSRKLLSPGTTLRQNVFWRVPPTGGREYIGRWTAQARLQSRAISTSCYFDVAVAASSSP